MQWMLLLDTCGEGGGVGIVQVDGATEVLVSEKPLPGRETQERLMPAIAAALSEARITSCDLDAVAVVTGPGSFTGVRIGLAAAKGLAEALTIPLLSISRLAVLASCVGVGKALQLIHSALDAGRGDVFLGRYAENGSSQEQMLSGEAASATVGDGTMVVMEDCVARLFPAAVQVAPVGVREAVSIAVRKLREGGFADTATLDANYLRVPDAELALRARVAAGAEAAARDGTCPA